VERSHDRFRLFVDVADSADLTDWKVVQRLTHSDLNFSSPGNVLRVCGRGVLYVQSYPIAAGERYGSEDSRLWLMASPDLIRRAMAHGVSWRSGRSPRRGTGPGLE
jgi:hypothetical protein